jgi:hypothetical protein
MDPHRADTLAGSGGDTRSRRGVLAALVGGPLALLGSASPAARKKGKKGRKGKKKTSPIPGSETVTRVFANTLEMTINTLGSASPFPSSIQVAGFQNATITDVDVVLKDLWHSVGRHVDVLLVAPDRRNAFVMGDVGHIYVVDGVTLRLDDEADAPLPTANGLGTASGAHQPTNHGDGEGLDAFDTSVAPIPSGMTALSVFDGMDPNGEWQLFIRDDTAGSGGRLGGGWELHITASVPIPAPGSPSKKKRRKKR